MLLWLIFSVFLSRSIALDNGLALTPPMGWLTWTRFGCITDCDQYPDDCISERLIKRTVDIMVSEGYVKAGYEYVAIDDCWLEMERDTNGRMVPSPTRFPSGMKALADYVHQNDMKFGMYQDYGNLTCQGYPGVLYHEETDIQTFFEWDIDYLKLDGCYSDPSQMDAGYPDFGKLLNRTGRPILYSCSWPAYQHDDNMEPNYELISKHCNLWRNSGDINDSWGSVKGIINWFGNNQDSFAKFARPGAWNDPDMLVIGNFGLTYDQAKVQMAVWAVLAAPLLMSADLAAIRPDFKEILLNADVIAVNQDKLGKQGLRIYNDDDFQVWTRELVDDAFAVVVINSVDSGVKINPRFFTVDVEKVLTITKTLHHQYKVKDLFDDVPEKIIESSEKFDVRVNPTGVKFLKFTPVESKVQGSYEQPNLDLELNIIKD